MKLYPMPATLNENGERFDFGTEIVVKYNTSFPTDKTIPLLCELWKNFTEGHSRIKFEHCVDLIENSFSINAVTATINEEYEYSVSITNKGIGASAKSSVGLVHAYTTLLQLITPQKFNNDNFDKFYINGYEIHDRPALDFRCAHLPIFKNGSLDFIKKSVRLCGLMKYSYVIIEFFGTYVFDCMKEFAYHEGSYSKEDIVPILDEARAFGIEIIPMFNSIGHATHGKRGEHVVLSQNPEFETLFEPDGDTYCLSNPKTKEILRNVRKEMIALCGEGKYFHIGGDEAYTLGDCDECSKYKKSELFAGYINEVAKEMKKLGRRVLVWGDTLLEPSWADKKDSFGHTYEATMGTDAETHNALELLDKEIVICDWQYYIWDENVETVKYFREKGFDVVPAGWTEVKNIDALCKASKNFGGMGYIQTTWSMDFHPITLVRGGVSSWMSNIDIIDKEALGRHNFVREYMLMLNMAEKMVRKMMPNGQGVFGKVAWRM